MVFANYIHANNLTLESAAALPGFSKRLFSFGVISDVQHANIDDGKSYAGKPRYYRNSLLALHRAVDDWRSNPEVQFAINFGDIIDFHAKDHSDAALTSVLDEFNRFDRPVYHAIGNHCLYNFPRPELNRRLQIPAVSDASYFSFKPSPELPWKIIMLDGYDISVLGWEEGHPNRQLAHDILNKNNRNKNKNDPDPMEGTARRFVEFGGGVSELQLKWLDAELKGSAAAGERVIVCCHLALHPNTCPGAALLWNYEEVLAVLQRYKTVVATLAGHTHLDGFFSDSGIHHRVLNGVIETQPGVDCHGVVQVYEGGMILKGEGALYTTVMPFAHQPAPVHTLREPIMVETTHKLLEMNATA